MLASRIRPTLSVSCCKSSPNWPEMAARLGIEGRAESWYQFVDGKIVENCGTEVFLPIGTPQSEIGAWSSTR